MQSRGNCCALWALLFAFTTSYAQQWDWVQRLSSESSGTAIGVDGNQNVYVAGNFRGTNYLGTNRLASAGGLDVFLAKLNRDGEVIWAISAGGSGDDSIGRLAVATNGALFVVGNFTIPASLLGESANNHSQDVSDVFVARVDDGRFTWFETLPAETGGIGGGVAFAPDESVWVVGATNGVFFFNKYAQTGAVLNSFTMSNYFRPTGLAVNRDEQLFVCDFYSVARVDFTGERRWQWSPGDGFHKPNIVNDIKCTPEGDVLSLGTVSSGFRHGAHLVQHAPDGTLVRENIRWGWSHKSIFKGNGLAVGPLGDIHVTGLAVGHYLGPQPSDGLWVASYDSNAVLIAESTIGNRKYCFPWNSGSAITTTPDGAIYITGTLTGSAFFGTNEVSGLGGAFVARRSTLSPELVVERRGDAAVISWPRTAFPFVLQQSAVSETNWVSVAALPQQTEVGWQVILPAEQASGMFRLLRTSEAPIRHRPQVISAWGPFGVFLTHKNYFFPGSSVSFQAAFREDDNESLTFQWTHVGTELPIPGETNVAHYLPRVYDCTLYPLNEVASLQPSPDAFEPGVHTIQVVASDGIFTATNSWTFDVITQETAVQEFLTALNALGSERAGARTIALWEAYLRSKEKGREHLAANRWKSFNRQLQRVTSLSEEERTKLANAASVVQALLLAE